MGGRDKPLLQLDGKTFVARIAEILASRANQVMISANRNLATYAEIGEVVPDEAEGQGPLQGIASCATRCQTAFLFVCPGDAPHLDATVIDRLAEGIESTQAAAVVASDGLRRQNLHLLLHSDQGARIRRYLDSGRRSVSGWLDEIGAQEVAMPDLAESFRDYDTSEDLT